MYSFAMSAMNFEVLPTSKARADLTISVNSFRTHGLLSRPILFGGHRKAEAAIIPIELFEKLLPEIENIQLQEMLRQRIHDGSKRMTFEELLEKTGFAAEELA
jgi:hypothetical protein